MQMLILPNVKELGECVQTPHQIAHLPITKYLSKPRVPYKREMIAKYLSIPGVPYKREMNQADKENCHVVAH